jgi:hypothetical protein
MKNLKTRRLSDRSMVASKLSWKHAPLLISGWAAVLAGGWLLAGGVAEAQVPTNQLHFAFTDASGTTTPSDTSLNAGALNATLTMFNPAGTTAVNLHGAVGTGVTNAIVTDLSRAMDFTSALTPSQVNQPVGNAAETVQSNAVVAVDTGDATLGANLGNGGFINNFVISMWFKQKAMIPNGIVIGPRLWILNAGSTGVDSGANANTLGLKFQQNNQLYFQFGTDTATVGPALASAFPTNKWLFVAVVYDGTNASMYYGSDTAAAQLIGTASTPGRSITLGGTACLAIGNRHSATANARGFDGWINDFRFYSGGVGTAAFVESVRESALGGPPDISGVYPDGTTLMQGTNKLAFNVSSPNGASITNVDLVLNGIDVSASLVTTGPASNLSCSFTGLAQNQPVNTAIITATDANGLSSTASATFDTFGQNNFVIEAEEFDFNGGQFIDNPDYTDGNPADANSYYGLDSVEGIDTHKGGAAGSFTTDYRAGNGVATKTQTGIATGEQSWPKFFNLQDASDVPIVGHMIGDWSSGEWQNYTKTFPSGNYNVYARASAGVSAVITLSHVISGQGTATQTTTNFGTFSFSDSSFSLFQWVPLHDSQGNLAIVNLAGVNTIRATSGGGGNVDFYMFVPANVNLPVITPVYPDGAYLFEPTNTFLFTVRSPITTITTNNIQLIWNGTNVSSHLVFSGGPSTWNVTFAGLLTNQSYSAVVSAVDALGNPSQATISIDTWNPVFQVEAEDWDFDPTQSPVPDGTGLRYIDNPVATAPGVAAANSYEGQVGNPGIDEFGTSATGHADYRPYDAIATTPVTDAARRQFTNGALDYNIGFLGPGLWQNYTRTWPSGTFNVYGRMASGANIGTIYSSWSQVIAGWGTANQITRHLGSFNIPSTNGYSSYINVPLLDRFGNYAQITLGGTNTFRTTELTFNQSDLPNTAAFGLNINFYMLLTPRTDLPRIDNVSPDGSTLMQPAGTLSFVASSPVYGLNTTNIQVTLSGVNISSNLAFSGSSSSWNVSYTGLQPNTNYSAVITITDNNNQVHTTTVTFDTFNPTNFTWEAEDYDFDPADSPVPNGSGLRYINNPVPTSSSAANSYFGQQGDIGIDFSSVFQNITGTYPYRSLDAVSTEVTSDTARQKYLTAQLQNLDPTIADYDVNFFTNWIDYTRTFPAGKFYLYARLAAGNGAFTMTCAQVTSGAGTTLQTSNVLGSFTGSGTSFATWQYVPLVNPGTGVPVVLSLGGVETLQMIGDANENANFFTLVPVGGSTGLVPTNPPAITGFSLAGSGVAGGNVVITGTNALAGATYYLLTSTNVAAPFSQWRAVATNVVSAGTFTFIGTNAIAPNQGRAFYILSSTNNGN